MVILAGVVFGPISAYLKQHSISRAVESARTLNTLLSQYATDNDGVYLPSGGLRRAKQPTKLLP